MGIKTNRVISALKASPYSEKTLQRREEGKYSTVTGAAISATQNSSRILGTGLGAYTLARLGIKLFNPDANSDSFLSSWKGVVTLALSSIAPFVADALIPIKPEPARPQEVKPSEQTDTDTAVQEPEKVLLYELFKLEQVSRFDLAHAVEHESPTINGAPHVRLKIERDEGLIRLRLFPALDKNSIGVRTTLGELSDALDDPDYQIPHLEFVREDEDTPYLHMYNVAASSYRRPQAA